MKGSDILSRIINKGGIMSAVAKMYINDEEKANQFIRECSEQCHNQSAKDFWGEELVTDIIKYCSKMVETEELI